MITSKYAEQCSLVCGLIIMISLRRNFDIDHVDTTRNNGKLLIQNDSNSLTESKRFNFERARLFTQAGYRIKSMNRKDKKEKISMLNYVLVR